MSNGTDAIRTIGWYTDETGVRSGGSLLYTYWNGVSWSARAHGSWAAEDAGKQAESASFIAPQNPRPVGIHASHNKRATIEALVSDLRRAVLSIEARVADLERREDPSRKIESIRSELDDIRSGLRAASCAAYT